MKKYLSTFSGLIISLSFFYSESKATSQVVTIANFQFTPTNFTIDLGDTVLFSWISGSHTTTSTSVPGGAVSWSQSINSTSTSFIYVPLVAGTYNYQCAIHTSMIGQFTVVQCVPPDYSNAIAVNISACDSPFVMDATNPIATNYQWIYNGNSISGATNASYLAINAGSYATIVSNSCGVDTTPTNGLAFIPKPTIAIEASNDTICSGQSITFIGTGGLTYSWWPTNVFPVTVNGDTATSNPTFSTEVVVLGTSFNGCSNSDSVKITVLDNPQAEFSFTQNGNTVTTSNTSFGAAIYDWNFGDGFTTNNPTPSHTYTTTGVFTIQLIATNAEGCTDTFEMVVDLTSGISESQNEQSILISVDASNHKIILSSNENINSSSVNLFDISGRILPVNVKQNSFNSISLSTQHLVSGVYFVEVLTAETRFIKKVIIN